MPRPAGNTTELRRRRSVELSTAQDQVEAAVKARDRRALNALHYGVGVRGVAEALRIDPTGGSAPLRPPEDTVSVAAAPSGNGWTVRWWENGRQRKRRFDLKRDAESFDSEVRRRKQLATTQLTRKGPTLDRWIEQRWTPEHGATLQKSTMHRYAEIYSNRVLDELGSTPVNEISVTALRA